MKILCIGPLWRGSNAGGLFRAFSRQNAAIEVVDEFYYISLRHRSAILKGVGRCLRSLQVREFNNEIVSAINTFKPKVLFVYKGAFVEVATLQYAKSKGCKLVNFFPDVSIFTHGKRLPLSLPLYDIVFTTKTFGANDLANIGVKRSVFVPHGFDPEIHRAIETDAEGLDTFVCDVSFIGTWSPKKEHILSQLASALPELKLFIWGDQWYKCRSSNLKKHVKGATVLGDLYAMAINGTTVNLGILSEQVSGASSGDLITSRTFHIPACKGFMLHERNTESVSYFIENQEAAFFDSCEELIEKTRFYLHHDDERNCIRHGGYKRAMKDHSLDARAKYILSTIEPDGL